MMDRSGTTTGGSTPAAPPDLRTPQFGAGPETAPPAADRAERPCRKPSWRSHRPNAVLGEISLLIRGFFRASARVPPRDGELGATRLSWRARFLDHEAWAADFGQVGPRRARCPSSGPRLAPWLQSTTALALVVLFAGAEPAAAQSLTMRSGQHATFTRLTLPVPASQSWQVGRTEDGYGLRLPTLDAPIDTAQVFARIPRNRLADLRPAPGGLDLVLGCSDCHANVFREGGLLVIDIRDGVPPPEARFEAPLVATAVAARPLQSGFDWTHRFAAPVTDASDPGDGEQGPQPAPMLYAQAGPARDLLVRQFARAAAQGLIGAGTGGAPRRSLQPDGPVQDSQEALALAEAALRNLRIDAQTGLDRARQNGRRIGTDRDGHVCPSDHLFEITAWADERPLLQQLALRRDGLLGEFDRPIPEAVQALAQLYIHAGFGAEAVSLLTTLPVPDADLLLDMARLLDEARPLPNSPLSAHVGCDGPVALWAVLAADDLRAAGVIDREAVWLAFSALPLHLRRHIGPQLAERFLALGDVQTAQTIRSAMTRVDGGEADDRVVVLDAVLDLAQGRPEAASERAAPAAAGTAPSAAEAMAIMVEARIAAGQPILPGTVNDLIALAQTHRGTPLGDRLLRLEALALTDEGRFDAAFAVRDRLRARADGAEAAERLTLELVTRLSERAGEEAMLSRVFAEADWRGGRLPAAAQTQLAGRLLDAGFAEEALDVFARTAPAADEAALVQARAALALERPGQALQALAGRTGSEAMVLRAEALLAMGDHRTAARFFLDAGEEVDAQRAAWLGGNWAEVARDAAGEDQKLAARTQMPMPLAAPAQVISPEPDGGVGIVWPPAPSESALSEARALLEASAELRSLVSGALAVHPSPSTE